MDNQEEKQMLDTQREADEMAENIIGDDTDLVSQDEEMGDRHEVALERRKEQLTLRLQGYKRPYIIDKLTKKYGVADITIIMDWQRRDLWLLDAISLTDMVETVGSSLSVFTATQITRQEILGDILRSIDAYKEVNEDEEGRMTADAAKQLEALYSMILRLLNDNEASVERKINMLTKMGILKEAAKHIVIDHKVEDKRVPAIDWMKIMEGMSTEARKEFFDSLSKNKEVIDV